MARQEDACWRCGTPWAAEEEPRTVLHAVSGGAPEEALLQPERPADEEGVSLDRAV
jgi:hypothetical protein